MPVVGRSDGNGVDGLVRQDLAEILHRFGLFEAQPAGLRLGLLQRRLIDIADGDDLEAGHLGGIPDIARAHAADPDERDVDPVVRAQDLAGEKRGGEGGASGRLQKLPAVRGFLCHALCCNRFNGSVRARHDPAALWHGPPVTPDSA